MKKYAALLLSAAVAATLVISATASSASDQSTSSIETACKRSLENTQRGVDQAFTNRDAHALTAYYHPDAMLINTSGTIRPNKTEIEAAFTRLFTATFNSTITPIRTTVEGCRTAVVVSDFLLEDPSDNSQLHFLASLTYTLNRGHWQILLDQSTLLP
jgi:uncharacterized protein (TIGR02246 family)